MKNAEIAKWYRLATEQGLPEAQFNLGLAYHSGKGVKKDKTEAAKWFSLAAEQGLPEAQFTLGVAYYSGEAFFGVSKRLN